VPEVTQQKMLSQAFDRPAVTALGGVTAAATIAHPGQSGLLPVDSGSEALRLRIALIDSAEQSIDAQYYIWNTDRAGRLVSWHLWQAAERGVRVRLLLDDFNVGDRDSGLASLAAHDNIAVHLYNPNPGRGGLTRLFGLLANLDRLNRRMHNKALLVDGAVAVAGGRNIGDEYFDLDPEMNFRDRELLVAGPAVTKLEHGFDDYWNHPLSVPIAAFAAPPDEAELARQVDDLEQRVIAGLPLPYPLPAGDRALPWLRDRILPTLTWAPTRVIHELPAASIEGGDKTPLVAPALVELIAAAEESIVIESAYLVLRAPARELIAAAIARGVTVRALTNSLASNDVLANHAGYARHRRAMVATGMDLYELRPDANACREPSALGPACGASPRYGLHSKSAVIDGRYVFLGSFNLNPRSALLNTESVMVVDSPALAARLNASSEPYFALGSSWRLSLDEAWRLRWHYGDGHDDPLPPRHEPEAGGWRSFKASLLSKVPYIDRF